MAVEGALDRARTDQQRAAWSAWTTAALGRQEKMPDLDKFLGSAADAKPRKQTWEEQLAGAAGWVASLQAG